FQPYFIAMVQRGGFKGVGRFTCLVHAVYLPLQLRVGACIIQEGGKLCQLTYAQCRACRRHYIYYRRLLYLHGGGSGGGAIAQRSRNGIYPTLVFCHVGYGHILRAVVAGAPFVGYTASSAAAVHA